MVISARAVLPNLHITGSVTVDGAFTPTDATATNAKFATNAEVQRGKLAQLQLAEYVIAPTRWRVWNNLNALLGTAAADDLGITSTTFGTNSPAITAGDIMGVTSTRYARALIDLPMEYDAGETVLIRIYAGMLTTIADLTCNVDVEIYESDKDGTNDNVELIATAPQSINFLMFQAYDFVVTSTDLTPGAILDTRITVDSQDDNSTTAVTPTLGAVSLLCDIRG